MCGVHYALPYVAVLHLLQIIINHFKAINVMCVCVIVYLDNDF